MLNLEKSIEILKQTKKILEIISPELLKLKEEYREELAEIVKTKKIPYLCKAERLPIRIFNKIKQYPEGISRTELYRGIGISKSFLLEAIQKLKEENKIVEHNMINENTARDIIRYFIA
jgi:hypothetical protein